VRDARAFAREHAADASAQLAAMPGEVDTAALAEVLAGIVDRQA
jgi:hypothetical protein